MEEVPAPDQHAASVFSVRVVIADPPAYTPYYDHDLAAALATAGADVELVTSRFRFAELPAPKGYRRNELFYPLSSRVFRRSRLRVPVKGLEHPLGMFRLNRRPADVVHVQWLSSPQLDERLLRLRAPSVFTAHDLLPRRTASKLDLWRRLLARFDRVVVHSERGRERLAELGVDARVIPLPISASNVERRDDGRTLLFAGTIRPYKGLPDALEVVRRIEDCAPARRRRPERAHRATRRQGRVAARLPAAVRARPRARRGDRGALPVPPGARPERGADAGARRRCAGGLLRRRWDRRARAALRRGPGRAGGGHRRA